MLPLLFVASVVALGCQPTPIVSDTTPTSPSFPPHTTPTPLVSLDERVVARTLPNGSPVTTRTNCPHLASGLKHWHDAETWGGSVPTHKSSVTLPADTNVLLSSCSVEEGTWFNRITIPEGSSLVFNDDGVSLKVKQITVMGRLWLGSETCRMLSATTVEFIAKKSEAQFSNGIQVVGKGEMDAHGKHYRPTWTRLAATAEAGSDILFLKDKHNWEVGQDIVVVTSTYRDVVYQEGGALQFADPDHENEKRKIVAIAANGKKIQLDSPLEYTHYAGTEYQTEVGMLSRRIVFQGSAKGEEDRYGGHVQFLGQTARGRISGVRAFRMGQANVMGRYPFHFHNMKAGCPAPLCYIQDTAVEESYWRCWTIHGTDQVRITNNVGYNVYGHCLYLEDGVEEENQVDYNMVAHIHTLGKPTTGGPQDGETFPATDEYKLPADRSAACYYISNARNYFIGNAASGGWTGFAFPIFTKPLGSNQDSPRIPHERRVLEFDGNTAHSAGYDWNADSCVYSGGHQYYDDKGVMWYLSGRFKRQTKTDDGSDEEWMLVTNLKTWLCRTGFNSWGQRIDLIGFECHDCQMGSVLFGEASQQKALINGRSGNPNRGAEFPGDEVQGFKFYDTTVKTVLYDVIFRNFRQSWGAGVGCLLDTTHSDVFKPSYMTSTRRIQYENVDRAVMIKRRMTQSGSAGMYNFRDWDGTATLAGKCTQRIAGSHLDWWNDGPDCHKDEAWGTWICPVKPGRDVGYIQTEIKGRTDKVVQIDIKHGNLEYVGDELSKLKIGTVSRFGDATRQMRLTRNKGITGITGFNGWYLHYDEGSPNEWDILPVTIQRGTFIIVAIRYPAGTTFEISRVFPSNWKKGDDGSMTVASSKAALLNGDGTTYFWDSTTQHLYLKLVDTWSDWGRWFERAGVRIPVKNSQGYGKYHIKASCGTCKVDFLSPAAISGNIPVCDSESDLADQRTYKCSAKLPKCVEEEDYTTHPCLGVECKPADSCSYSGVCNPSTLQCTSPPKPQCDNGIQLGLESPTIRQERWVEWVVVPYEDVDSATGVLFGGKEVAATVAMTKQGGVIRVEQASDADLRGDLQLVVTKKNGGKSVHTFPDWLGNKDVALTIQKDGKCSKNWLRLLITPQDFLTNVHVKSDVEDKDVPFDYKGKVSIGGVFPNKVVVTATAQGQTHEQIFWCFGGSASTGQTCDDGDSLTCNDQCQGDGTCKGLAAACSAQPVPDTPPSPTPPSPTPPSNTAPTGSSGSCPAVVSPEDNVNGMTFLIPDEGRDGWTVLVRAEPAEDVASIDTIIHGETFAMKSTNYWWKYSTKGKPYASREVRFVVTKKNGGKAIKVIPDWGGNCGDSITLTRQPSSQWFVNILASPIDWIEKAEVTRSDKQTFPLLVGSTLASQKSDGPPFYGDVTVTAWDIKGKKVKETFADWNENSKEALVITKKEGSSYKVDVNPVDWVSSVTVTGNGWKDKPLTHKGYGMATWEGDGTKWVGVMKVKAKRADGKQYVQTFTYAAGAGEEGSTKATPSGPSSNAGTIAVTVVVTLALVGVIALAAFGVLHYRQKRVRSAKTPVDDHVLMTEITEECL